MFLHSIPSWQERKQRCGSWSNILRGENGVCFLCFGHAAHWNIFILSAKNFAFFFSLNVRSLNLDYHEMLEVIIHGLWFTFVFPFISSLFPGLGPRHWEAEPGIPDHTCRAGCGLGEAIHTSPGFPFLWREAPDISKGRR